MYRKRGLFISGIITAGILTLAVLPSCDNAGTINKTQINNSGMELSVVVTTYPSVESLNAANDRLRPNVEDKDVKGFFILWKTEVDSYVCELHVLDIVRVDDDRTTSWGHELAHCVYGNYHK